MLFVAVAATARAFWTVDPTAGKFMLPYLAFVGYANALNYNCWKNNPDVSASDRGCGTVRSAAQLSGGPPAKLGHLLGHLLQVVVVQLYLLLVLVMQL